MPKVIFTSDAVLDLEILRELLRERKSQAPARAARILAAKIIQLSSNPKLGRPVELTDGTVVREFSVSLAEDDCTALFCQEGDAIVILLVRHKSEVGYCL